jgi:hypothetical protein
MRDGWQAFGWNELRTVSIWHEDGQATVPQCALAVRRTQDGTLELAVFGKGKQPLLSIPLKQISDSTQKTPIAMSAERDYDAGRITLRILGQYEASLMVTEL